MSYNPPRGPAAIVIDGGNPGCRAYQAIIPLRIKTTTPTTIQIVSRREEVGSGGVTVTTKPSVPEPPPLSAISFSQLV